MVSKFDHTTMRKKITKMNWMDGSMMDGLQLVAKYLSFLISSMAPKPGTFFDLQTCLGKRYWLSRPPPLRDNVPHGLLSPTLLRFVSSALSHKMFFFLAKLALQGNRANGKKSLPGAVPGPKKRTKTVPKSGSFQKEVFCSVAKKKSQKLDRPLP